MEWVWLAVIIFAIILLGALIFVAVYGQQRQYQTDTANNVVPLAAPVSFLYRCSSLACDTGYQCDPQYGVCKLPIGTPCQQSSQCVSPNLCSGVCTAGPAAVVTNQADDPCPCPANMICSSKSPGSVAKSCKLQGLESCTADAQCYSNSCLSGICTSGAPNGAACTASPQCSSGNCSSNWCQPPGTDTGQLGATCAVPPLVGPACVAGLSCVAGVCSLPQSGLGVYCTQNSDCSDPLACNDIDTGQPCANSTSGAGCVCQYNYSQDGSTYRPSPNACNQTGACIDAYLCSAGVCQPQSNQPCLANGDCQSGVCLSQGAIYQLQFVYLDGVLQTNSPLPSNSFGSFSVFYAPVTATVAPPTTGVSRLLAYTDSGTGADTLLYVVAGQGVFDLQGNNIAPVVSPPGSTLIDGVYWGSAQGLLAYQAPSAGPYSLYNADGSLFNGGQQFSGSTALTIAGIDRSTNGDVLLLDTTSTLYVLPVGQSSFSKVQTNQGASILDAAVPRFYQDISQNILITDCALNCPTGNCTVDGLCQLNSLSWQNIGYVAADPLYGQVLQFTGNLEGALYPVFDPTRNGGTGTIDQYQVLDQSSYSDPVSGIAGGSFIMVATNQATVQTNLFLTPGGGVQAIAGLVGPSSKVAASAGSFYLYSVGVCA